MTMKRSETPWYHRYWCRDAWSHVLDVLWSGAFLVLARSHAQLELANCAHVGTCNADTARLYLSPCVTES